MPRRPILPWSVLLAIILALLAYALLADAMEFYLLSCPLPDESRLNHRLGECALLWVVTISAAGWILRSSNRILPDQRAWPILLPPLVIGVCFTVSALIEVYRIGVLFKPDPWLGWYSHVGAAMPLVFGAMGTGLLWGQARCWRRRPACQRRCGCCGYDLQGLKSLRCPECSLQIDESGVARPPANVKWYPELLLFDTARERDEAWKAAFRPWAALPLIPWAVAVLLLEAQNVWPHRLPFVRTLAAIAACFTISFAFGFLERNRVRRRLRMRLIELGCSVCPSCGGATASGEACPACRKVTAGE